MQTSSRDRIENYSAKGWWENDTLQNIFETVTREGIDRPAIIDPSNRNDFVSGPPMKLSYEELTDAVDKVGSWLFKAGLRQGDIILVQMPNTVEIVLMYIAAAKLGLIVSPVAMQYGQFELKHIGKVIEPHHYIAFRNFRGESFGEVQSGALPETCQSLFWGADDFNLEGECKADEDYLAYVKNLSLDPNDIFTICWTSGTTGRSKGVPRSHNQWLASALAVEDSVNLPEGSIYLNPFPFINMAAIGGFLYFWLKNRGTMILHHPFDPTVYLSQIQNENVVYTLAPPALLNRLLETKAQIKAGFDLSKLKIIGSGSAPLSPHMIEGFKEDFDIDVINVFGSNEGSALLSSPREVPDCAERALFFPRFGRKEHKWPNRIHDRLETKLLDLESGNEVNKPGQVGELCITGATVFDGYYKSPEDNAQAFTEDGYFRTGDLFEIAGNNDEFYQFIGRCKALIVRGGVNISPEELDELLVAHPAIMEGAVAAYPDKIMGEKICAVVVPYEGQSVTLEDIKNYLDEKKVAKFKWPERLHIMEALPRNAMNKVVRKQLEDIIS
ncbi:MAG: class I adenylate-forming enzyme family protein [Hellea sp.]